MWSNYIMLLGIPHCLPGNLWKGVLALALVLKKPCATDNALSFIFVDVHSSVFVQHHLLVSCLDNVS